MFALYRYRYLLLFTLIGFLSIVLEVVLVRCLPAAWPGAVKTLTGFTCGMVFAFYANAILNFKMPRRYFLKTFALFCAISCLSYSLNVVASRAIPRLCDVPYPLDRFATAGLFFLLAYFLHRRFTFDKARKLGVAIYAAEGEDVDTVFGKIGWQLDHVHVDLVDQTMDPAARTVDLEQIDRARKLWPRLRLNIHLMSKTPLMWLPQLWGRIDGALIHLDIADDPWEVIAQCRIHGKKVGVVWTRGVPASAILPFLPHIDMAMVLGVADPGRSGQTMMAEAVEMSRVLEALASRYRVDTVFDGGLTLSNSTRIPAQYIISSSGVLQSDRPLHTVFCLITGRHGADT